MAKQTDHQRFWKKVDTKTDPAGCWVWTGGKSNGYGIFCHGASKQLAHRFVLGLKDGAQVVLHSCDNPACVNPAHLVVGTQADNMRDMVSKGRHGAGGAHGERHPAAKFSAEDVVEIRGSDASHSDMARRFNVTPQAILYVRTKGWKSVSGEAVKPKSGYKGKRGENNPTAKLQTSDIVRIRTGGECPRLLAAEYQTQVAYINRIRSRKAWKHVE